MDVLRVREWQNKATGTGEVQYIDIGKQGEKASKHRPNGSGGR